MFTAEGKLIKTTKDTNITIENSGVYFIKVETIEANTYQKVVVE